MLTDDLDCIRLAHTATAEDLHAMLENYNKAYKEKEELMAEWIRKGTRVKYL